jgi:hypothetical protein
MPEPVSAPVDFLSGDYAPDDSINSARLSGRYLTRQGVPWDLMAWSFSRGKSKDGRNQKTAVQLEREAAVVLALGGGFQAYFTQKRDGSIRDERVPVMAEVAKFCRERQAFCHHATPVPQVAVLFSTAAHYRKSNGLFARDLAPINAALQALLERQQSVEIQSEHHLAGRMVEYPLIVVPELEYLEPKFKEELVAYVQAGGNLVLIGPKTAALFQADLGEPEGADQGHPRRQGDISFRQLGRGKIGVLSFTLSQDDERLPNNRARGFFNLVVRELFPKPMVEVKGSSDVDVVVNRLGGRLAVNLVNTAGPHQTEPILDSIPPVGPLDIRIRIPDKPTRVTLEPGGQSLPFLYGDGEVRLLLPQLEIHSIIVVD